MKWKRRADRTLLITLVHGTWGRGFFPNIRLRKSSKFWFEEGSDFRRQLCSELHDRKIHHEIRTHLWSGANSVFERSTAALDLAKKLHAESTRYPSQMVIAHSHGGNVALRALVHFVSLKTAQAVSPQTWRPLLVTMATPFLELHQASFGMYPAAVRGALRLALVLLSMQLMLSLGGIAGPYWYFVFLLGLIAPVMSVWILLGGPNRHNKIIQLRDRHQIGR